MIGGLSNKISKPPAKLGLLAVLSALIVYASHIIQAVIISWLSEILKRTPTSFFIQAIKNILSIKLSLLPILVIFICFYFFACDYLVKMKKKQQDIYNDLVKKQQDIYNNTEENKKNLYIIFEEKLSEFIFDLFESHLDDDLIGIVETALKNKGQDSQPLVTRIIQGLEGIRYFGTHISYITVFRPDEFKNYLIITNCVPELPEKLKEEIKQYQYIGNVSKPGLERRVTLASTTYKKRRSYKIFFKEDEDRKMTPYLVDINKPDQLQAKQFEHYINLGDFYELQGIKSIASFPLMKDKNSEVPLGVMCVDSSEEETFISSTYDDKLLRAARCLSIAIEIQDLLEELNY
jgi:hypothetical protein